MCERQAKPPYEAKPYTLNCRPLVNECYEELGATAMINRRLKDIVNSIPEAFAVSLPPEDAAKLQLCFDNLIYGLHGLYRLGHELEDGETTRICHNVMYPAVFHGIGQIRKHFGLDHSGRPVTNADSAPPEDGA